ncbi:MAG: cytochrome C [Phycisphaeraceae bacterium]|nr:MAG: cytochrome C [Phycisphaeraceae bacterium]
MVGTNLDTEPGEGAPATQYELTGDEPATRPGLFVQPSGLQGSVHDGVTCVECHTDSTELPHKPKLNLHTCGVSCHAEQAKSYDLSTHMEALAKGDEGAPDCVTCHGGHNIESTAARDAPVYRLNIAKLCGDCHVKHTPQEDQPDGEGWINKYLTSAHAKAMAAGGLVWAATCVDCHGAHGVLPSADERSKVSRAHIPETCGGCHVGVSEVYAKSIHGQQLVAGNERAPVCSDCHASHAVTRATEGTFALDVINECGQCHDNPEDNGRIGTRYKSYLESYHGQATELGSRRAARCSDCHGTHDILPPSDPASRVYKARLKQTCGECHPGAGKKFVEFDPHANYRDSKNYPVLFGVWMYFMIMMSSVFTFFGLHTLLWFFRAKIEHAKIKGTHEAAKEAETAIRRFTLLNRINHALVVITFFGLTATGIPLVFSHENWANVMMGMFGGVHVAGTWHRFFATMLICNFAVHFYGLGRAFLRRKVTWYQWIFGPESLVPRWKDATDAAGMIKWFFVGGKVPKFDRWTYWEKFDYWAEVGGSMIIGGSGMLLWFPEIASWMFPGWMFNVAMIVHGYEALLAIGFIFTIHFFNAHLRPGVFPVDEVIFTGSMPEEEFKHHRPAEYERLVAAGRLDEYRVPAPSSRRKPLILATAIGLVSIGVVLLTLILIGGFSQL